MELEQEGIGKLARSLALRTNGWEVWISIPERSFFLIFSNQSIYCYSFFVGDPLKIQDGANMACRSRYSVYSLSRGREDFREKQ